MLVGRAVLAGGFFVGGFVPGLHWLWYASSAISIGFGGSDQVLGSHVAEAVAYHAAYLVATLAEFERDLFAGRLEPLRAVRVLPAPSVAPRCAFPAHEDALVRWELTVPPDAPGRYRLY